MTASLSDFARQSVAGLRLLLLFTLLLGIGYPTAVWAIGRAVPARSDGQLLRLDGQVVGSRLIGQDFTGDEWFHSRPSNSGYDPLASGPSNLGPRSEELMQQIDQRRAEVARTEQVPPAAVPADALTASGSGLDPHISPQYARLQVPRVARSTGLPPQRLQELIAQHTDGPFLGVHGEDGVNVLELNLAVRQARTRG